MARASPVFTLIAFELTHPACVVRRTLGDDNDWQYELKHSSRAKDEAELWFDRASAVGVPTLLLASGSSGDSAHLLGLPQGCTAMGPPRDESGQVVDLDQATGFNTLHVLRGLCVSQACCANALDRNSVVRAR